MKKIGVFGAVIVLAIGMIVCHAMTSRAAELEGYDVQANVLKTSINEMRRDAGLEEFVFTEDLDLAAEVRAEECSEAYSSVRPDGTEFSTATSAEVSAESLSTWPEGKSGDDVIARVAANPLYGDNIFDPSLQACGIALHESDGEIYVAIEYR